MNEAERSEHSYIRQLTRELKMRNASKSQVDDALSGVIESQENGADLQAEFGHPTEYAEKIIPGSSPVKLYGFTLGGLVLGALGFILLNVDERQWNYLVENHLTVYLPLLLIPIGIGIDFWRYLRT